MKGNILKHKIVKTILVAMLLLSLICPKVHAASCPNFLYVNDKYITIWTGFTETTASGYASTDVGRNSTLGIKKSSYGRITWYVGTDLYRYDVVSLRLSIYANGQSETCSYQITMK